MGDKITNPEQAKENFEEFPTGMDAQIRSKIINHRISSDLLNFYKKNFNKLIKNNLLNIEMLKKSCNIS